MTSVDAKLLKAMNLLGVEMDHFLNKTPEGFKTRFKFQKYVYILQSEFRLSIGSYNLYLRGPYSTAVAEKGFYLAKNLRSIDGEKITFAREVRKRIEDIEALFTSDGNLSEEDKLEAWTTYHYIKTLYPESIPPKEKLFKDLFTYKPGLEPYKEQIEKFLQRADGVFSTYE